MIIYKKNRTGDIQISKEDFKTKKIEQRFKAPGLAFERGPTRSTLRQVAAEIGDDKKCLR